jgi:H+/Cl- antiporter ClcA
MVASPDTDPTLRRDAPSAPAGGESLEVATRKLRAEWQHMLTAAKRAFYVERQAFGLKVFDIGFQVVVGILGGFVAIALCVAAAVLVVLGARRGLVVWTHDAWWVDLVLGTVILGVIGLAAHLARRAVHKSTLKRTQAQLGLTPPQDPAVPAHLVPPPTHSAH